MARKYKLITGRDGRDKDKTYFVMEMPADQATRWSIKAFFLLAKSGMDIPEAIRQTGMAGIAEIGMAALFHGISFDDAEPLLDELYGCIRFVPIRSKFAFDPNLSIDHQPGVRHLVEGDAEEVVTQLLLRAEAFKIHTDFSKPGAESTTNQTSEQNQTPGLSDIPTSPIPSRPSYPPGKRHLKSSRPSMG